MSYTFSETCAFCQFSWIIKYPPSIQSILDNLQYINKWDKNCVYGYIRNVNLTLIKNNKLLNYIPDTIAIICLWYYFKLQTYFVDSIEAFNDINLKKDLIECIHHNDNYKIPTQIEKKATIPIIQKRDVVIAANNDNGIANIKIPIMHILDPTVKECQILIIVGKENNLRKTSNMILPLSWELLRKETSSIDTDINITRWLSYSSDISSQIKILTINELNNDIPSHALKLIVIENINTIYDIFNSQKVKLEKYLDYLYQSCQIQVIVMDSDIGGVSLKFIQKYMRNPVYISMKPLTKYIYTTKQIYVAVEIEDYKLVTLYDIIETAHQLGQFHKILVYVNTKRKVIWIQSKLIEHDIKCFAMYNDMNQNEIKSIINEFDGECMATLVCSDWYDISMYDMVNSKVTMIINYDLPTTNILHTQRMKNCGTKCERCNENVKNGIVHFVMDDEEQRLREIEKYDSNVDIVEAPMDIDDWFE